MPDARTVAAPRTRCGIARWRRQTIRQMERSFGEKTASIAAPQVSADASVDETDAWCRTKKLGCGTHCKWLESRETLMTLAGETVLVPKPERNGKNHAGLHRVGNQLQRPSRVPGPITQDALAGPAARSSGTLARPRPAGVTSRHWGGI